METNLPNTYPFGSFVDVYVIMECVLVGHTNVQAQTMEQNMKLKLEADEALFIKTFKNKLPILFGLKAGEGNAYCLLVTSTKIHGLLEEEGYHFCLKGEKCICLVTTAQENLHTNRALPLASCYTNW
eukprot:12927150-Ditylum_brightwellii.AAC.2